MSKLKDIPSVIQDKKYCFLCGSPFGLDKHHAFNGAFRSFSVKYGLWIWLDRNHHHYVHTHEGEMAKIREYAQKKAMEHYGWTLADWMQKCGRNFLCEKE